MSRKPVVVHKQVETTGHSWDGIEELNNPLPRWWLWTFYASIAFAVVYMVLYPAIPLPSGATQGVIGFNPRTDVELDIVAVQTANAPIEAALVAADLNTIATDPALSGYVRNAGAAVFKTNCATCHGAGAAGATGYPNLLDNDWLWGGAMADIVTTVTHGIRNTVDGDARYSQMPAFGVDELLTEDQIGAVVQHVMALSGQDHDAALAVEGSVLYAENCVACHGEQGMGNREIGAPNLTDAIWLYGGDQASLTTTIYNARFGVMPPWNTRLSEAEIRAVAAYVHQLGGGE